MLPDVPVFDIVAAVTAKFAPPPDVVSFVVAVAFAEVPFAVAVTTRVLLRKPLSPTTLLLPTEAESRE